MGDASARPTIALHDLHKSFGAQPVLTGLDLNIDHGQNVAVLGRSGTGKSVLLKILVGLQKPDSGSVCIEGEDIADLGHEKLHQLRTKIGFLFQDAALYDSMTIEDNVAFPLQRHRPDANSDQAGRAKALLASVGLESESRKMPGQISGGMKKRVGLARALALQPSILLLDEPTAGLDPITAGEIEDLILRIRKEHPVTSIVVTHDLRAARTIADRLVILDNGGIVFDGTFEDLTRSSIPLATQYVKQGC
jgi:phospholipid/cholesterol/gamma-HCH transport system ATP-binding protein